MYQNRLKDLREDNDLKQEDVAKLLDISRQYYSRYELGQVELPIRHYIKLAKYYNVSIDYLAGIIPEMKHLNKTETKEKVPTQKELALIEAYQENKDFQKAIDKLLDIGVKK